MKTLKALFDRNAAWAETVRTEDPHYFERLAAEQTPQYLWIGCSDARVPANEVLDLMPGEIFVHRNVSNLVVHSDMNCLSVIQFAVEVLQVSDIIVVGHFGCGGVIASMEERRHGLIDNWLLHIRDVYKRHRAHLGEWRSEANQINRLCEFNVIEQSVNVCNTTIVQDAWARGQVLNVHGWVYGLSDGTLSDLKFCVSSKAELAQTYAESIEYIAARCKGEQLQPQPSRVKQSV